ncbi:MAG: TonB-dependent receptor [Longimicrobiales bacterium]|nr:TonB-dependent receptor [Longimicrobiales bacterium]
MVSTASSTRALAGVCHLRPSPASLRAGALRLTVVLALGSGVFLPAAVTAQAAPEGAIRGTVLEAAGLRPIEGATVHLLPGDRVIGTNADGAFLFEGLQPGSYRIVVRYIGLSEREEEVRVVGGRTTDLEMRLDTEAVLIEPLQVTATRARRGVNEVPAQISVVSRAEIDLVQASKIGDLFAALPGVEVSGVGPFEGLPVIRGLSGNRVLVLVDGQRLNNSREAINFGGVQPGLVDIDQIEEVEVLRGPSSVLYGSDALGGIVNIITRRPPFPSAGLQVGGNLSSTVRSIDESRNLSGNVRVAGSRVAVRLSGSVREAENFESPDGEVVNSGAESFDLGVDLDIRLAEGRHLRLEAQRFEADDVGIPGTSGVFTGSFPFTDRDKYAVEYRADAFPLLGSVRVHGYFQDQEENFSTLLDLPPIPAGPFALQIDSETERVSDVETYGFGFQAETLVHDDHRLTWGIEVFEDDVDERRRETTTTVFQPTAPGPPPMTVTEVDSLPTTPEATFRGIGVYLQDEIEAGRWRVTPGVRFDRFDIESERLERSEGPLAAQDRTEEAVSASLGILFHATEEIRPTLSVGRAFRTPNVIERFFFGPGSQGGLTVPNPDLDNETSLNVDVGVKFSYPSFRGSLTYFRNRIDDFITFQPGTFQGDSTFGGEPITQVRNVGEVRIQGVEAEAEYVLLAGGSRFVLSGVFSWNEGEDLEEDRPLFVAPLKTVLGVRWDDPGSPFTLSVNGRAVADQDEVPEGFDATDGFLLFNARASLDLRRWLRQDAVLRFGIENLTDELYREPFNATSSPGRSFETSLSLGF